MRLLSATALGSWTAADEYDRMVDGSLLLSLSLLLVVVRPDIAAPVSCAAHLVVPRAPSPSPPLSFSVQFVLSRLVSDLVIIRLSPHCLCLSHSHLRLFLLSLYISHRRALYVYDLVGCDSRAEDTTNAAKNTHDLSRPVSV